MTSENEAATIDAGKTALKVIIKQGKKLIDEWVLVGKALALGEAIKSNQERGKWYAANFPGLSGQANASTRRAAVWLAGLPEGVLQGLKNDGKSNHPVALQAAFKAREAKPKAGAANASAKDRLAAVEAEAERLKARAEEAEAKLAAVQVQADEVEATNGSFLARYRNGTGVKADMAETMAKVDAEMGGWVRELADGDDAAILADAKGINRARLLHLSALFARAAAAAANDDAAVPVALAA
ncbi:hypothetical protein ACLF3G_29065 [Falsiroseomonas sp. HC035]|uniref:hypothetical protein n=1 Tax=Falsiroseomonas sp. HC035 TaxID=3390999 RepID=UPI003D323F1C